MGEARRRRLAGTQHQVKWTKPVLREIEPNDYIATLRQHCLEHADDGANYDEIELWALHNSRQSRTVIADFTYTFHPEDHRWKTPLAEFANRPVWVAWRNEPNPGKLPNKVPYRGIGQKASSTDPTTWRTLAEAEAIAQALLGEYGLGGGVGIMLGPITGLIGIDLDSCRDPATEAIAPWAAEVIERFGSYTEVSPSKTGAKIFAIASDLPAMQKILGGRGRAFKRGGGKHPPAIEVFTDARYFCVTGWRLGDAELRTIPVDDFRWLIEEAGPNFVGTRGKANGHDEPRDASRSVAAFRLGAALRRRGKTFEEMVAALHADPETAEWAAEKGERNGQRELRRIWDKVGDTDEVTAVVEEFNDKYLLVSEAGKAVIYQPKTDPGLKRRFFDRLTPGDLRVLYLNKEIQIGFNAKKQPIFKTAAEIWLHHPDRRQFIGGVTFDPTGNVPADVLNLWEGFAVKPIAGDWSLMRQHIEIIICDGDPIRYEYLMDWMARMAQFPAEQGEVAVVMQGGEGTGKGTLANALLFITGQHGLGISNGKHLTGNFNLHLRDCVFLFADEALFAGDRSHIGVLNSLITEPYLTIEGKRANIVQTPNRLHVMMASNERWVVSASMDSRRYFVLEVSDARKGDFPYFEAIVNQMEAGGYEAVLHELMTRDISAFNVRNVPTTEGLLRQRSLSLPTTEAWWKDCLERGYVFRSERGHEDSFAKWHDRVSTELLFQSYLVFAKGRERRPLSREHLGRFFTTTLKVNGSKWRNGVVGENFDGPVEQERVPGYVIGTLEMAREDFIRATKLDVIWDAGVTGEPPEDEPPKKKKKKAVKY